MKPRHLYLLLLGSTGCVDPAGVHGTPAWYEQQYLECDAETAALSREPARESVGDVEKTGKAWTSLTDTIYDHFERSNLRNQDAELHAKFGALYARAKAAHLDWVSRQTEYLIPIDASRAFELAVDTVRQFMEIPETVRAAARRAGRAFADEQTQKGKEQKGFAGVLKGRCVCSDKPFAEDDAGEDRLQYHFKKGATVYIRAFPKLPPESYSGEDGQFELRTAEDGRFAQQTLPMGTPASAQGKRFFDGSVPASTIKKPFSMIRVTLVFRCVEGQERFVENGTPVLRPRWSGQAMATGSFVVEE